MENKYIEVSPDDQIFKLLDPYGNIKFSNLKGLDLQQILYLIDEFYLVYRKKLGIDKKITFGFEVEVEKANGSKIEDEMDNLDINNNWIVTDDASLDHGVEINSPVLTDKKRTWEELKLVCDILNKYSEVGKTTGSHIHIGSQILGDKKKNWLNLLKMWSVYENIIYRFLYGEYLTGRPKILTYAIPSSTKFKILYKEFKDEKLDMKSIIHRLNTNVDRYSAVGFQNVDKKHLCEYKKYNTIEFRVANGTINPIIWQNNLNMIINMLLYLKSSKYDLDTIEKRGLDTKSEYLLYDEIYLDQALEFCDLIFENNYDKVYFLKEYLKGFEYQNYKREYSKAKELTKK